MGYNKPFFSPVNLTRQSLMPLTSTRTRGGTLVESLSTTCHTCSGEQFHRSITTVSAHSGRILALTVYKPRKWGRFNSASTMA